MVKCEAKFVFAVSAQQEQNYSQIVTYFDGILRKRDDMIISFNCSQWSRRYERGWFSRYEISWEFSAISGWVGGWISWLEARDNQEFSRYLISRESASLVSSRSLRKLKWNYHIVSFSENTITKSSNLRIFLFLLSRHGSYKYCFTLDQNMFFKIIFLLIRAT